MTKPRLGLLAIAFAVSTASLTGQTPSPTPSRVRVTDSIPSVREIRTPVRTPTPTAPMPRPSYTPMARAPQYAQPSMASNLTIKGGLSFAQIKSKIAEAKRFMTTRPLTIASVASTLPTDGTSQFTTVRVAFYDPRSKKIDYVVLAKDDFLRKDLLPTTTLSANGTLVSTRTIRANGVNTPITITDMQGTAQVPLLAQYPVEREGRYIETAYYMSTHPGLVTPEVVGAGQMYVRNVIDIARASLSANGMPVQPRIADWAERLATVEHVDHLRFRTEFHPNIYNDIFTLYALNEGQTYRYSVSSAGAGGMVQMIPWTYRMIRSRYPSANLMPDFVEGMRNHVNASKAMLLYMQMTWNDLASNPTIANAITTGIAREEHLMAAGYNSNPARLAGYVSRGGAAWATLIPRETKIYLQIWDSLERSVRILPRTN